MAQWAANTSRGITHRVIAEGTLVLETPAHFGIGEQDGTEMIILQDVSSGSPLLPGASQAGALRHYLLRRENGYRMADNSSKHRKTIATKLFGEALDNDRGEQSRIIIHDAYGGVEPLRIRDGVKIDGATRTANDGALFNVQVWPEGTSFGLHLELCLYEGDDNAAELCQAFAVMLTALSNREINIGARKHRGYGRCKVAEWRIYDYDLTSIEDFLAWILEKPTVETSKQFLTGAAGFVDRRQQVKLTATFALCDSLMIRSGAQLVDNTHLTDASGQPIVSGTTIAGALRARALKIANTVEATAKTVDAETLVDDLFGRHGSSDSDIHDGAPMTASRLVIQESAVSRADISHIQNRVKIDRFTGGAFETALISEQPAFATDQSRVELNLELQCPSNQEQETYIQKQVGLLLLLLKDLWTEDLPLGGESSIGRGRLKGLSANLTIGTSDAQTRYTFNEHGLADRNQICQLQKYVDELWRQA